MRRILVSALALALAGSLGGCFGHEEHRGDREGDHREHEGEHHDGEHHEGEHPDGPHESFQQRSSQK